MKQHIIPFILGFILCGLIYVVFDSETISNRDAFDTGYRMGAQSVINHTKPEVIPSGDTFQVGLRLENYYEQKHVDSLWFNN